MQSKRLLAMVLVLTMIISSASALFVASAANVEDVEKTLNVSDEGIQTIIGVMNTDDSTTTNGAVTITAPTKVNVGEQFTVTYTFTEFEEGSGNPGCFVIPMSIDTKYITLKAADVSTMDIVETRGTANTADTWTDASNFKTAATATAESTIVDFNLSLVYDDIVDAIGDTFTVEVYFIAQSVGETSIEYKENINLMDCWVAWDTYYTADPLHFEIVDPNAEDSSEVISSEEESSEDVSVDEGLINLAPSAQYKGDGQDNGTSGNYCEAPGTDWEVYHAGKLNDGIIPNGDAASTKGQNVEVYTLAVGPGEINVIFKLADSAYISIVDVYMNDRDDNAKCGYPDKIEVYVGYSEDFATATYVGEATTTDPEGAVRLYSVAADVTGSYVLIKFTAGEQYRITLSEVGIWGYAAEIEDETSEETSEDISSEESSEVISSEEESSEVISSEEETSEDISSEESSEVISSEEESSEDASSEESSEDISSEESSDDEPSEDVPAVDVPLVNVAGDAEYMGDGTDNGTTGNYCEAPGVEWETYHAGKLNDGIIPDGDASVTLGQNVELYRVDTVPGEINVFFKLAEATDVKLVNVYMNNRTNNDNTGYPAKIEVYVGDSEDFATATYVGEATTTDPEGAIRLYSVAADVTGSYVLIKFTTSEKWRITVSEIEIMTEAEASNIAPNGDYKATGVTNGTGNYGEESWTEYHDGKLTDGVIPTGDSAATKGQNVEIWLDGFVSGTAYVYFKFDNEAIISEAKLYMNTRATSGNNRGYPANINVYVGDSEDISTATFFGTATTTDPEGAVRAYSASGNLLAGTYVIFEVAIQAPAIAIAYSEIEIIGYGGEADVPVIPELNAPTGITGNLSQMETFEAPTISWDAVEGAVAYDVYVDDTLVGENLTDTTYTIVMDPVVAYGSNTSYSKATVVAKGDGVNYIDSARSESYNFFYVEKPLDLRGNRVTSADIIIDPGHGGSQPGAVNGDRQEKDDTLDMSLRMGEIFEALGYTVAYTRIEDVDDGLMSRAAKVNAGDFKLFICVHRNSFTTLGVSGIEVLHETGDTTDEAYAQAVLDELVALDLFKNRGLKPRDNLVVTNNASDSVPTILVELGFISNINEPPLDFLPTDNELFDANFDEIALAMVKGSIKYLGYNASYAGNININGTDYSFDSENNVIDVTLGSADAAIDLDFIHALGMTNVAISTDGETWADQSFELIDSTIEGFHGDKMACASFNASYSEATSLQFKVGYALEGETLWATEEVILTVNFTVDADDSSSEDETTEEPSSSEDEPSESEDESYLEVEDNLLLGKDYTVVTDATVSKADSGNLMTNGAIRGDKNNAWNGDLGVNDVSVEWFGTSKTITYTFTFDAATDVSEIVFRNVRIASNRAFGTLVINGSTIVLSGQWTKTPVAGAPLYGQDGDAVEQYFDVSVAVDLQGITELSIGLITDMYVCQYDEIMAFGAAGDEPSSDVEPSEETSEETSEVISSEDSEETSEVITSEESEESEETSFDITSEESEETSEETSDDETSDDVADVVYGDVNNDGAVNSLDAAQTLKHDAKLITLDDAALAAADVNGDGTVNSLDAAQVLKFDAKLIDSFPVEDAADEESSEELSAIESSDAAISEDEEDSSVESSDEISA
ncbi:MAG: hypothetical protein E7597_03200 [Ruminococcaceae bacterium]|nr:hypothetical protein [Oscillospiraceae bacterium]